jgi:hypothetical protein
MERALVDKLWRVGWAVSPACPVKIANNRQWSAFSQLTLPLR